MRWLLPLLLVSLTSSVDAQKWVNPCCTATRAVTVDSTRVWTTTKVDSARYNKRTNVVRAWPSTRVDSTKRLCELEPYVVDIDSSQVTVGEGDSVLVAATVTHCGGQTAPNVIMTWLNRNDGTGFDVDSVLTKTTYIRGVGDATGYIVAVSDGGGADSVFVTSFADATCTPTATHICPGDNVNAKVQAQAAGTSFTFGAGTYFGVSIAPKNNMTFTGAANRTTIFDGGRVLTGWTASGGDWFVGGQTQGPTQTGNGTCQAVSLDDAVNYPRCKYSEQLWIDSTLKRHVDTRDSVKAGTWFFDYTADQIWVGDDPNGRLVETSVTTSPAFTGTGSGVTVTGFKIRHYATTFGSGAVVAGAAWTIDDNAILDNSQKGVRWDQVDNVNLVDNLIKRNAQLGISASGNSPDWIDNDSLLTNRVDSNNTAGWRRQFSAGAMKVTRSRNMVFLGNRGERNLGNGFWWDIDNQSAEIVSDTSNFNDGTGFFYEISAGCHIDAAYAEGNGLVPTDGSQNGAGIVIAASENCEVENSIIKNNAHGIVSNQQNRTGDCSISSCLVQNLNVHDNTVTMSEGNHGYIGAFEPVDHHLNRNNVFECNDYFLTGATEYFNFEQSTRTDNEWTTAGHDDGACSTITRE